jgi:hypothetical protein
MMRTVADRIRRINAGRCLVVRFLTRIEKIKRRTHIPDRISIKSS